MALIPPGFLDCVTAIGFRSAEGDPSFTATGFLYGRPVSTEPPELEREYNVFLVTNRHVFEGRTRAVLRFNPAPGNPARVYDLDLLDGTGEAVWITHSDPDVDVAVMPVNAQLLKEHGIQFAFFQADKHVLRQAEAQAAGVSEGDSVFVLGFPLADPGTERNYVIVRHGVVARIRDSFAGTTPHFLVDASIFPGNSGGPVVTKPELVAITGTKSLSTANLLGMVQAYVPYQDVAFSRQTNRPRVIFEENSGLALVIPVDRIVEVGDMAFEALRRRSEAEEGGDAGQATVDREPNVG